MIFYISQIILVIFLCVCCYKLGKEVGFYEGAEFGCKYSNLISSIGEVMAEFKGGKDEQESKD